MSTNAENLYRFPAQYGPDYGSPVDVLWYQGYSGNPPHYPTTGVQGGQKQAKQQQEKKESSEEASGTIELKVHFCCDGVVSKVTKKLYELDGVGSVICDRHNHKVTVKGPVKREKVLKQVKTIKHLQRAAFVETKKSKS